MLFIATKYAMKGYSQSQMRDGDDCYHLKGDEGEEIKTKYQIICMNYKK